MNNDTKSLGVGRSEEETNMSLDTTSHPNRPGPNELIRSGYALRVGEIDALVVSDGTMSIPAATLAVNAAPADLGAWLDGMFLPARFGWPLNVGVVRSGGRTVLIDAGLGVEFPEFAGAGQLTRRLEAAGLGLESLTDVVLTHMHMDHIGGLLGLRDRLRPDLRIHVSATEAEFWAGKADLSRAPPCRRGCRSRFGRSPSGSWTSTAAGCSRSRRNTRWRRGCSSVAPAATPPGTAWSAWSLAATG